MHFYLWKNGSQTGPYDLTNIESSLRRGDISATVLARLESSKEWMPLERLMPKKLAQPPQAPQNVPAVVSVPGKPINKSARRLAYGLSIFGIMLLLFGCTQFSAGRDERLYRDLAERASYRESREMDESSSGEADALKEAREHRGYFTAGLGSLLLLGGMVLRVFV